MNQEADARPKGYGSKGLNKVEEAESTRLEKAMATHSSTLAWKLPWTEEPRRLQSMGS